MSDKVIGIAVLDKSDKPEILHILCHSEHPAEGFSNPRHSTIPVYLKGDSKPSGCAWEYRIDPTVGGLIHVSPSVRERTTRPSKSNPEVSEEIELFHNDGQWDIPVEQFVKGEFLNAYDLFRSVNNFAPDPK